MTNPSGSNPQQPTPIIGQPMPPAGQPVQPQQPAQSQLPLSVCGILAVVFGAIGFVLSFIPIINNIAAIFGFVGVVLGIIAIIGTFRNKKRGKVLSIIGAVLSVLAIIITLSMQSAASKAIDEAFNTSSSTTSSSTSDSSDTSSSSSNGTMDTEGDLKDGYVKIVSAVKSANDYNGDPTVLVTYDWTNKSDENTSFMIAFNAQAFQNGQQLDSAIYSESPEGYDSSSELANLQPNASGTVTVGYVLKDDSPVTIEVSDLINLTDNSKVTRTFDLN